MKNPIRTVETLTGETYIFNFETLTETMRLPGFMTQVTDYPDRKSMWSALRNLKQTHREMGI